MNQAMILCAFCGLGLSIAMAETTTSAAVSASSDGRGDMVMPTSYPAASARPGFGATE